MQLIPSLTNKEVKESLKNNEEKLTLRFNTCLVLMKDIEHVVKNATNTWKNVYLLHKPINSFVSISDKDDDDKEEKYDVEVTHFDNIDDEEEQKQEATEEETHNVEEIDLVKIVAVIIASLSQSPRKNIDNIKHGDSLSKIDYD